MLKYSVLISALSSFKFILIKNSCLKLNSFNSSGVKFKLKNLRD